MPDKRTAALDTIEVNIAWDEGILVIDTLNLALADQEQKKVVIKTILNYFALTGTDFKIGNLNLKKVLTTSASVRDVLLMDANGNIKVRDVSQLIASTNAVQTEVVRVSNQATESITGLASSQRQINEQNVGKLNDLQDQIENVVNVAATGTIYADPTPFQFTDSEQIIPFSILFDSTDTNVIEFDAVNNVIIYKANGIYQHSAFMKVGNATPSALRYLTLYLRDVNTLANINTVVAPVEADGYIGTWTNRFAIENAPQVLQFIGIADDPTDLTLEAGQISASSITASGIPETVNEYFVDVFGTADSAMDVPNVQSALSTAMPGYTVRLFGSFIFNSKIDIYDHERITLDCKGAFINWQTSAATFTAFDVKNCSDIHIINLFGNITHLGTGTSFNVIDIQTDLTANNDIKIQNLDVRILAGTITTYNITVDDAAVNTLITNISGVRGIINMNDGIISNVKLTAVDSKIVVADYCSVSNSSVYTIEATGSNNVIVSNLSFVYTVDIYTNILTSNLNQTEQYIAYELFIDGPIAASGTITANAGMTTTTLAATGAIYANGGIISDGDHLVIDSGQYFEFDNTGFTVNYDDVEPQYIKVFADALGAGISGYSLTEQFLNISSYSDSFLLGENFGLDTDTPEEKLHVIGNIKASGNVLSENVIKYKHHIRVESSSGITVLGDNYGNFTNIAVTSGTTGIYSITYDSITDYNIYANVNVTTGAGFKVAVIQSTTSTECIINVYDETATLRDSALNIILYAIPT